MIAAVFAAVLLMYGVGGSDVTVQMLVIALATPVFTWFELESEKDRLATVIRLVGVGYWCLSIMMMATLLVFETAYKHLLDNSWNSFLANALFGLGTAVSFGFASFAILARPIRLSWKRIIGLIAAAYFSYFFNREFDKAEFLILPFFTILLTWCFRGGERMAEYAAPTTKQIWPLYQKLRQMWPRLAVFVIGYLCIIVFFTGAYASIERTIPKSFAGSGIIEVDQDGKENRDGGISWFLHLSVATGTTLGYGDVYPTKSLSRMATSAQVLLSLGWTIIVFAAAIDSSPKSTNSDKT